MKLLIAFLLGIVILLQYELWFAESGVNSVQRLQHQIDQQLAINAKIQEKNELIIADINSLRNGAQAIEEHARSDLGMVKKGEVFYQISPDS